MSDLIRYLVDCKRGGKLLATYEFAQAETAAGPPPQPTRESLEKDAKANLIQQGLAFPPFDGITFHIRVLSTR
jgi:hypothetical protein